MPRPSDKPAPTLEYRPARADRRPSKVAVRVVAALAGILVGAMPVSFLWEGEGHFFLNRHYAPSLWAAVLSAVFLELVALDLIPPRRRRLGEGDSDKGLG